MFHVVLDSIKVSRSIGRRLVRDVEPSASCIGPWRLGSRSFLAIPATCRPGFPLRRRLTSHLLVVVHGVRDLALLHVGDMAAAAVVTSAVVAAARYR